MFKNIINKVLKIQNPNVELILKIKQLEDRIIELGNTNIEIKNKIKEYKEQIEKRDEIFRQLKLIFDKMISFNIK